MARHPAAGTASAGPAAGGEPELPAARSRLARPRVPQLLGVAGGWLGGRTGVGAVTGSAVALMVSSLAGSGLGLLFWVVAARLYPAETVGRAAATVSAALVIATLAQLNLAAVYVRFLGLCGPGGARFVARGYALTGALAVAGSVGFCLTGLGDSYLGTAWSGRLPLVALTVLSMLLTIQDAVLTALRRATTVMVANVVLAASKLSLLACLALFALPVDIVWVWLVPMTAVLAVVSYRVFARYLPAQARESDGSQWPGIRRIAGFVSAEYLKGLLGMLPPALIPLVVVHVLGVGVNAYFTVPWTINAAVMALFWSTSGAFVAAGVAERGMGYASLRRLLKINAVIVLVGFAAELLTANIVLELMGHSYAEHGAGLLRWLALGLPFEAVTGVLVTFVWLEGRLWRLVALQALDNVVFLGLGLGLLPSRGIVAIGFAFFVSQALLGVLCLGPVVRRVRAARRRGVHAADVLAAPTAPAPMAPAPMVPAPAAPAAPAAGSLR